MTTTTDSIDDILRAETVISNLKSYSINLIAIDFDLTLVSIHTGGRWQATIPELTAKIRPFLYHLVRIALNNEIMVAIVTFSPQVGVIREVLQNAFPDHSEKIPIRGNDDSWGKGGMKDKQNYIASASEELQRLNNVVIRKDTTLLLDDDANNIKAAIEDSTYAIHLDPRYPDRFVERLIAFSPGPS